MAAAYKKKNVKRKKMNAAKKKKREKEKKETKHKWHSRQRNGQHKDQFPLREGGRRSTSQKETNFLEAGGGWLRKERNTQTENVNGCLHQEGALQKESEDNDPRGRLLGSLISYPILLSYSWHPSYLIPTSLSSQSSNKMPEYLIMPMWYETIMTDGLVLNGRWKL